MVEVWTPRPGDVCVPRDLGRGAFATVIELKDDVVIFDYNNGNPDERHTQKVRASTFTSRYELLYRPEPATP